jgi:nucleoside-diphosphate-sugar epimerase
MHFRYDQGPAKVFPLTPKENAMQPLKDIAIIGLGPVGRATMEQLSARGATVRVCQRHRPADLPAGVSFQACDVLQPDQVAAATAGAAQVVLAIGLPYVSRVWREAWPRVMSNVLAGCVASGARLVFVDNLYMYGPQTAPLHESMPLTDFGVKPAARSDVTRLWQAAHRAGQVRVAAVRAPDFYGPGVENSHFGGTAFRALAAGKPVSLIAPPDSPHDVAYVPDFGRAVVSLLDAPDDAFGRAWHVPCAPTLTPRQLLETAAHLAGQPLRIRTLPLGLLPLLGFAMPMLREVAEMRFTFDRPYRVDARDFSARFWPEATSFAAGSKATLEAIRS